MPIVITIWSCLLTDVSSTSGLASRAGPALHSGLIKAGHACHHGLISSAGQSLGLHKLNGSGRILRLTNGVGVLAVAGKVTLGGAQPYSWSSIFLGSLSKGLVRVRSRVRKSGALDRCRSATIGSAPMHVAAEQMADSADTLQA